jgi:hypothetical protein
MQVLTSKCVTGVEVSVPASSARFGARRAPSGRMRQSPARRRSWCIGASQHSRYVSPPMSSIVQLFSRTATAPLHTHADLGGNKFALVYKSAQSLAQ